LADASRLLAESNQLAMQWLLYPVSMRESICYFVLTASPGLYDVSGKHSEGLFQTVNTFLVAGSEFLLLKVLAH